MIYGLDVGIWTISDILSFLPLYLFSLTSNGTFINNVKIVFQIKTTSVQNQQSI